MLGLTSLSGSPQVSGFQTPFLWKFVTDSSQAATVSNWYAASSAQALGLSMWESLACSTGGQVLIAIVIVFNGRAGAKYHMYVNSHKSWTHS
jgi:cytosine/uracil/thiamine/allantoin permease